MLIFIVCELCKKFLAKLKTDVARYLFNNQELCKDWIFYEHFFLDLIALQRAILGYVKYTFIEEILANLLDENSCNGIVKFLYFILEKNYFIQVNVD